MNSKADNHYTKKKFYIYTLGCKVNQYESQAMRELLIKAGFEEAESKNIADIYVVNTCTVTGEADRESRKVMERFHRVNPSARIVATGCLMEKNASELSSVSGVTDVLKNSEKNRIAEVAGGGMDSCGDGRPGELTISGFKGHSKAYVKIQDGCENRCAYCKVPLVRGQLRSRSIDEIFIEVKGLINNGFKEIVLTGICLGAWGKDLSPRSHAGNIELNNEGLLNVLKRLYNIDGDFRIRLSSIEPKYVTMDLIKFMAQNGRMCAHLHIPFQSGDDEVLKLMNRPYTADRYRAIVDMARREIPHIAITTDILIGFPGESDARFEKSMAFVKAIAPARTHIFTFSGREGTPAFDMPDKVDHSTMRKRYDKMSILSLDLAREYKKIFIGKELNVLVETTRDKETGLLKGYSDNYIQIQFDGHDNLARNIVPVRVVGLDSDRIIGKVAVRRT